MISKKTAIITGCNRGIGKEILRTFAKNEANIWACTREKNDEFSKEIDFLQKKNDIWIRNINFDFADEEATKQAAKKIISESNSIDILVNNAGVIETSLFQMTKINSIRNMFHLNFTTGHNLYDFHDKKLDSNLLIGANSNIIKRESRETYYVENYPQENKFRYLNKFFNIWLG